MAETSRGSRPIDFKRLKVSRQEMPASTRMRAFELSTIAVFPRLPLASTETETPMLRSIPLTSVETGVTSWLSHYLRVGNFKKPATDLRGLSRILIFDSQ